MLAESGRVWLQVPASRALGLGQFCLRWLLERWATLAVRSSASRWCKALRLRGGCGGGREAGRWNAAQVAAARGEARWSGACLRR